MDISATPDIIRHSSSTGLATTNGRPVELDISVEAPRGHQWRAEPAVNRCVLDEVTELRFDRELVVIFDFYISYAAPDRAFAAQLHHELTDLGLDVYFDRALQAGSMDFEPWFRSKRLIWVVSEMTSLKTELIEAWSRGPHAKKLIVLELDPVRLPEIDIDVSGRSFQEIPDRDAYDAVARIIKEMGYIRPPSATVLLRDQNTPGTMHRQKIVKQLCAALLCRLFPSLLAAFCISRAKTLVGRKSG
ncbi:MAG: toll/interleukin-1 receptor domain-containing protein, partial [Gammaproteobacteria bacterium]|nr:toll/interleukin-1 receptor domain-containing protein [Gammaproteobacteria bacterium]